MKIQKQTFAKLTVIFFLMLAVLSSPAIEGLKLQIHCPNVVLLWPSAEGEAYIVQFRETLDTNFSWITLTNQMPPDTGTNITVFVHSNRVDCPPGQIFGMMRSSGGENSSLSSTATALTLEEKTQLKQAREEARLAALYEKCKLEGRGPYDWELKNQPPLPPSPEEIREKILKAKTAKAAGLVGAPIENAQSLEQGESGGTNGPEPQGGGGSGGIDPGCGFYRVVRTGLHLFGVTNGTVLSGEVSLPVEIGFDDGIDFEGFYASVGDPNETSPANELDFETVTNGLPKKVVWDTRQVTNGTYQIYLGCQWGEFQQYESPSVTVVVSNQIWFPDSWNVASYYINVEAQSIHTNGTYQVTIFDDTGFQILQASGTNDNEGFVTYAGLRGFVVENFDQNGEIYPSVSYQVAVNTAAAGGGSSATTTNTIWTEFKWPATGAGWTKFAIGYQPIFGNPSFGGLNAVALQSMIQTVYGSAQNRPGFPQGQRVIRGSDQNPNELWGQSDFTQLLTSDLRNDLVRNLYYFGHGSPTFIGEKNVPRYLSIDDFNFVLRNNLKDPLAGTNAHPFRFVWLDGCYTAKGNLCKAFGIPKQENVSTNVFNARGVRYRAFMGWSGGVLIRLGSFNTSHSTFVSDFWERWPLNDTNGRPNSVRDAHTYAGRNWSTSQNLKIYGYEGLWWQDTLP